MAPSLRTLVDQGKSFWSRLPTGRRIGLVGGVVLTAVLLVWLTRSAAPRYSVLYSGLSPEDAGELKANLESRGVPHRLEAGGTAIAVPSDRVLDLRLQLAEAGLPKGGGVGFEVFDRQSFGTTTFVEQMNYRRALQGELARTITSLDAVDAARVHLALGERSLYKDDEQPPSASVVLKIRRGRALAKEQVRAIVHMVSSSVDGLAPDRITVVDERGDVLSSPDDDGDTEAAEQATLEKSLTQRIQDLMEKIVGPGKVAVTVTAEFDHSQVATTEETFANEGVPRSESRVEERTNPAPGTGGIIGARANLPGAPEPVTGINDPNVLRYEQTKNYEISKTVRNITGPKVRVARLHVALVVDALTGADGKPVPRPADELARIEALARDAAGLDPARGDRISVQSVPFSTVADTDLADAPATADKGLLPGGVPVWAAAAGGGVLLVGLIAFLLLRRRRRKAEAEKAAAEVLPRGPVTVGELAAAIEPGSKVALPEEAAPLALPGRTIRERALEAARADAERAARIVSAWLAEAKQPT
jgi:flagellar M-ring protein FliF